MKNADKKIKLRFWQKAYLLTLALFLLCINGGILSLTVYTHGENVKAAEEAAKAQQYSVAVSFERDMEYLAENGGSAALLMEAFGAHYKDKGLFIAFEKDGVILYSDFPEAYEIEGNSLRHADLTGKRHILISSHICGGDYRLVVAKNVESLDEAFRSLMVTYLLTALGVSLFLAVCLYFVLRRLSKPLDSLRKTTQAIGNGDFSVTAEERGNDEFTRLAESFNAMLETINRQMADLEDQAEKKQMLVDDEIAFVGTVNLDYRSLVHHYEDAVWMYRTPTVLDIREGFLKTVSVSNQKDSKDARLTLFEWIIRNLIKIFAPLL